MRNQDEQIKFMLSTRTLILSSLSSITFLSSRQLWLKFLYLIFDKEQKSIENYFQTNRDQLIEICTNNQRLQPVGF